MKILIVTFVFLAAQFTRAQIAQDKHVLTVHVVTSRLDYPCSGGSQPFCPVRLYIDAEIDGHRYELINEKTKPQNHQEILIPGNYNGRMVKDEHSKPYRQYKVYELEYPDGDTEQFTVVGETSQ